MAAVGIPDYRLPRDVLRAEVERVESLGVKIVYNFRFGVDATMDAALRAGLRGRVRRRRRPPVGAHGLRGRGRRATTASCPASSSCARSPSARRRSPARRCWSSAAATSPWTASARLAASASTTSSCSTAAPRRRCRPTRSRSSRPRKRASRWSPWSPRRRSWPRTAGSPASSAGACSSASPTRPGRRRPEPIEGSEFVIPCDCIVPAIGQVCGVDQLMPSHIEVSKWKTLEVDPLTMQSADPRVFGGGDCYTGPSSLVAALGRRTPRRGVHRRVPAGLRRRPGAGGRGSSTPCSRSSATRRRRPSRSAAAPRSCARWSCRRRSASSASTRSKGR